MAGNDLQLNIVSDVSDAEKGIDKLEGSLKSLDATAQSVKGPEFDTASIDKSTAAIGKMEEQTKKVASGLGKTAASSTALVGAFRKQASAATAAGKGLQQIANTAPALKGLVSETSLLGQALYGIGFALGRSLSALGRFGSAFKATFSKLMGGVSGLVMKGAGSLGGNWVTSFLAGIAAFGLPGKLTALLAGAIATSVGAALLIARKGGQDFANTLTQAASAGLSTEQFDMFAAAAKKNFGASEKAAQDFAASIGAMRQKIRAGDVSPELTRQLKMMQISLSRLSSTDLPTFTNEWQKLYVQMRRIKDVGVRTDFMKNLGVSDEMIGKINDGIKKGKEFLDFTDEWKTRLGDTAAAEKAGESYDHLTAAAQKLFDAFGKGAGFQSGYQAAMTNSATVTDSFARILESLAPIAERMGAALGPVIKDFADLSVAVAAGNTAATNASLVKMLTDLTGISTGTLESIRSWGEWLGGWLNSINESANKGGKAVHDFFVNLGKDVANLASSGIETAVDWAGIAQKWIEQIVAKMKELPAKLAALASEFAAAGVAWGKEIGQALIDAVMDFIRKIPGAASIVGTGGGDSSQPNSGQLKMVPVQMVMPAGYQRALEATYQKMGMVGINPLRGSFGGETNVPGGALNFDEFSRKINGAGVEVDKLTRKIKENKAAMDEAGPSVAGIAAEYAKLQTSGQATNASIAQLIQTLNQSVDPTLAAKDAALQLEMAQKTGLLSAEAYAEGQRRVQETLKQAQFNALPKQTQEFMQGLSSWAEGAGSALFDAAVNGEDLRDVLAGLAKDLAKLIFQSLVWKPLMEAMGLGVGGHAVSAAPMAMPTGGGPNLKALDAANQRAAAGMIRAHAPMTATRSRGMDSGGVKNTLNGGIILNFRSGPGPDVEADAATAKAFGERVRSIIQTEMVHQSRPGGLLTSRGRG